MSRKEQQIRNQFRYPTTEEEIAAINNQSTTGPSTYSAENPYRPVQIDPAGYRALASIEAALRKTIPNKLAYKNKMRRIRRAVFYGEIDPVEYQQYFSKGGVEND